MDDFVEFVEHVEDDFLRIPRLIMRDIENPLEMYQEHELIQRYRFGRHVIQNVLIPLVYPQHLPETNRGLPIPPILKLCVALRFYASGSFQRVCGDLLEISQASCSRILQEVSNILALNLPRYVKFPTAERDLNTNRQRFFNIRGFPGVTGCIDGTHIEIKSPGGENAEAYRNRKSWMSLNVQVVSGACHQIFDIVIRWPGSTHDSRNFVNSAVKVKFEQRELLGVLLGDSAYPQTQYLFTPVPNPQTRSERQYNFSHASTRNVVERTFGIWKSRFGCISSILQYKVRNATRIIAATAVLHNIAIEQNEQFMDNLLEERIVQQPAAGVEHVRGNLIRAAFIQRHFAM